MNCVLVEFKRKIILRNNTRSLIKSGKKIHFSQFLYNNRYYDGYQKRLRNVVINEYHILSERIIEQLQVEHFAVCNSILRQRYLEINTLKVNLQNFNFVVQQEI